MKSTNPLYLFIAGADAAFFYLLPFASEIPSLYLLMIFETVFSFLVRSYYNISFNFKLFLF